MIFDQDWPEWKYSALKDESSTATVVADAKLVGDDDDRIDPEWMYEFWASAIV